MKVLILYFTLLSFALFHSVSSTEINPAHLGGNFSRSSREPKYKIEFHTKDSPYPPEDDQESVVMLNENGKNYICYMPKVEEEKNGRIVPQHNTSSMIVETEKRVQVKMPDELLEVLRDQCFIRVRYGDPKKCFLNVLDGVDRKRVGRMSFSIRRDYSNFKWKMRRYEKRYTEELKLKEAEQLIDDKAKQTSMVGEVDKAEGSQTNNKSLTSKSSSTEQDLDTFLLGDLEDSDGGQDDGNDEFDDDFDKIDNSDVEDEKHVKK